MLRTLFKKNGFRNFSQSRIWRNVEKEQISSNTKAPDIQDIGRSEVIPGEFDKKILVWGGKFKTVEDIPRKVSSTTIQHARTRFRIRVINLMMAGTTIMLLLYIIKGKNLSAAGDSTNKRHMEMNAKILANSNK